ncbi:MAG: SOS response-associated peptidase, partial [Myxococcales bacterium]|nr:SOS response-associated peptidase [Myxococcales bacterium]
SAAAIHDRMPVIIPRAARETWMDPAIEDPERLVGLLEELGAQALEAYPVDPRVGAVRNDDPGLLEPLA